MNLTHALLGEHAVFTPLFDHIEAEAPQSGDLAHLQAMGRMLAAALVSHARIEDDLLFAALDDVMETVAGPVAVMRQEHDLIEGGLARLPEETDLAAARRLLLQVVGVARSHFAKEEQVLFPLSAQLLGTEVLEARGSEWATRRQVIRATAPACH